MSARRGQLYGAGVAGEWRAWCLDGEGAGLGGGAAPRDWHVVAVARTLVWTAAFPFIAMIRGKGLFCNTMQRNPEGSAGSYWGWQAGGWRGSGASFRSSGACGVVKLYTVTLCNKVCVAFRRAAAFRSNTSICDKMVHFIFV